MSEYTHNPNAVKDAWSTFWSHAGVVPDEKPLPEKVQFEQERQEQLAAKAEHVNNWRAYTNNGEHAPVPDELATGEHASMVFEAAGLDVGVVAEVTGTSPSDVSAFLSGKQTFADAKYRTLLAAARDALNERGY